MTESRVYMEPDHAVLDDVQQGERLPYRITKREKLLANNHRYHCRSGGVLLLRKVLKPEHTMVVDMEVASPDQQLKVLTINDVKRWMHGMPYEPLYSPGVNGKVMAAVTTKNYAHPSVFVVDSAVPVKLFVMVWEVDGKGFSVILSRRIVAM